MLAGWARAAHTQPPVVATPSPPTRPRVSLTKPYRPRLDLVYSANFRFPKVPTFRVTQPEEETR